MVPTATAAVARATIDLCTASPRVPSEATTVDDRGGSADGGRWYLGVMAVDVIVTHRRVVARP